MKRHLVYLHSLETCLFTFLCQTADVGGGRVSLAICLKASLLDLTVTHAMCNHKHHYTLTQKHNPATSHTLLQLLIQPWSPNWYKLRKTLGDPVRSKSGSRLCDTDRLIRKRRLVHWGLLERHLWIHQDKPLMSKGLSWEKIKISISL